MMTAQETKDYLDTLPLHTALWWFIENAEWSEAPTSEVFFHLRERVRNTPESRTYAVGITDAGCEEHEFKSMNDMYKFLGTRDNPDFEDWYQLDVYPDGGIDFNTAPTGDDALEEIEEPK